MPEDDDTSVEPIVGTAVALERSLQTLIERHAEALLGVWFLVTEFSTTRSHGGRIDTLGIDESGSPVIIEYKRAVNENVIYQGLFYLNRLLDHRADFTKYDQHAIQEMPRNIDLVRYRRYGDDLLLEQFASSAIEVASTREAKRSASAGIVATPREQCKPKEARVLTGVGGRPKSLDWLELCSPDLRMSFAVLIEGAVDLGTDILRVAQNDTGEGRWSRVEDATGRGRALAPGPSLLW